MNTPTPTPDAAGDESDSAGNGSDPSGERQPSGGASEPVTPPPVTPPPAAAPPTGSTPTTPPAVTPPAAPQFVAPAAGPEEVAAPSPAGPGLAAPPPGAPQFVAPQFVAPQFVAPQFGEPQFGDPGSGGGEPGALGPGTPPEPPAPPRLREALLALGVAALITALGFPLGWLWSAAAPWVPAEKIPGAAVLAQPEQEQMVAQEGWYLLITIVAGLVLATLAWVLLRRYRGALVLLGLAVGGVLSGVLTLKFGHHIGEHHFLNLVQSAPNGTQFLAPVNLRVQETGLWHHWLPYARGDVLALAITACALYLLLAGFSAYPSLRAPDRGQLSPAGYQAPGGYPPAPAEPEIGTEPRFSSDS